MPYVTIKRGPRGKTIRLRATTAQVRKLKQIIKKHNRANAAGCMPCNLLRNRSRSRSTYAATKKRKKARCRKSTLEIRRIRAALRRCVAAKKRPKRSPKLAMPKIRVADLAKMLRSTRQRIKRKTSTRPHRVNQS